MQVRKLAVVGALIAATTFAAITTSTGTASAAPAVTVTPSTGLQDGQVVQVHAEGYTPNSFVQVVECPTGTACRFLVSEPVDAGGVLDVSVVAHAFIRTNGGSAAFFSPAPCNGGCQIAVVGAGAEQAGMPIAFVPDVAILDPAVGVTPASATDGQAVHVHLIGGYFDLGQTVHLHQCAAGWKIYNQTTCAPTTVDVTASATDGSVDATFTVRRNLAAIGDTLPAVDCSTASCTVVMSGQFFDTVEGAVTFAVVSPTTTITPATTVAPVVSATPRFTG